jgi:hypothetical protein
MPETAYDFVPPAANDLPKEALDSATRGASALDAYALTPDGRNFLAHALVQLARDGWLTQEPNAIARWEADGLSMLRVIERMRQRIEPQDAPAASTDVDARSTR